MIPSWPFQLNGRDDVASRHGSATSFTAADQWNRFVCDVFQRAHAGGLGRRPLGPCALAGQRRCICAFRPGHAPLGRDRNSPAQTCGRPCDLQPRSGRSQCCELVGLQRRGRGEVTQRRCSCSIFASQNRAPAARRGRYERRRRAANLSGALSHQHHPLEHNNAMRFPG